MSYNIEKIGIRRSKRLLSKKVKDNELEKELKELNNEDKYKLIESNDN
jgi:hypothetical protein